MRALKTYAAAAGRVVLTGAAQAALVDRGGGMIHDTTRNITWLVDMICAATSGDTAANVGGTGANAPVPMRDATLLRTDVFRRDDDGHQHPVSMCAHPDGKDDLPLHRKTRQGYGSTTQTSIW